MDDRTEKKVNGDDAQTRKRSETRIFSMLMVFMLMSTLIMFTFLVVTYMAFQDVNDDPRARLGGGSFTEPYGGSIIKNGGGWEANVGSVSGARLSLSNLTICVKVPAEDGAYAGKTCLAFNGTEDMSYRGVPKAWFMRLYNKSVEARFINGTTTVTLNATTAPTLDGPKMPTLEGVVILYRDMDNDGNMSNGDKVLVFRDPNGDGQKEFPDGTKVELRTSEGKAIASAILR